MRWIVWSMLMVWTAAAAGAAKPPASEGAKRVVAGGGGATVAYQLPTDGPLPRTYRVTLAVVDANNPDWIVSQFARGVVRTVTAENGGKFAETWDGLDDNFMPVPPGTYGVKGIYMPASEWAIDGEYHSVTPRLHSAALSWVPGPDDRRALPFGGDPTGAPIGDVAVGPNGVAVFYYTYLENGLNNPQFDLNKPIGMGQFVRAYNSGGAGGGECAATDGETVWAFSTDGGPKYVYRADGKSFGSAPGANRANSYAPAGWVTGMAVWRDERAKRSYVYVAQRGRIVELQERKKAYRESDRDFVDQITVHDGEDGKVLGTLAAPRPRGLAVRGNTLYVLHADGEGWVVSAAAIEAGVPKALKRVFAVPSSILPVDLEVDRSGRFYLSDSEANKVYQLDEGGRVTRTYGRLDAQQPGTYDRLTLMSPGKLATWTDAQGQDRLIIVEKAGPNRVSEWSAADGSLIREFTSLQTKANDGYAIDPEHPTDVYVPTHLGWLTRFKVDYAKRTWTVDAVWPEVGTDPLAPGLIKPVFVRANGRAYLAGAGSGKQNAFNVYRQDGDRWVFSAAIIRRVDVKDPRKPPAYFLWNDANGNGRVDAEELRSAEFPGPFFTAHGQNWGPDLSFLAIPMGGQSVWRLAPAEFDAHGNPVFTKFEKLLTDPVFAARAAGTADATHGGNELAQAYTSDWYQADGTPDLGYYVQARGGRSFNANEGSQYKVSRYVPDGRGGYALKWRTGRTALQGVAQPGEVYGAMRVRRPINGLVSVIDQSRCGVLLFTEDGLYVDTLFADGRRLGRKEVGEYAQGGEFFAGQAFANKENGRVYLAMGKYTPVLFEVDGWSLTTNPARPLADVQREVTISAGQIGSPPEIALSVRGGAGAAKVARFAPALGGANLDGSLLGWEACEPVNLSADKEQTVEVRCLYDPDHVYLRWHARLGRQFAPRPMPSPERVFTHDQEADTLSFYVQGDDQARPGKIAEGRPGDARFVMGVFTDGGAAKPVCVGMYPDWPDKAGARPQVYRTPVGQAAFAHVGLVDGAELKHTVDADGKGFVLTVAVPRSAIPALRGKPFAGGYRTLVNFEATFAGHNKFWWANADGSAGRETNDEPSEARFYPGWWAPAEFRGIDGGVAVRNWMICGPFGGPGFDKFTPDPHGPLPGTKKDAKQALKELCLAQKYAPDEKVDLSAVYTGDLLLGYWRDPRQVKWAPAEIATLDKRVILGPSGQTWFGVSWVHVPKDTPVEFQIQGHPQTSLKWTLNGQEVFNGEVKQRPDDAVQRPTVTKPVTLKAGWNEVKFRGFCVGYPPFRAGLVIGGAPEALWTIRATAAPPGDRR